MQNRLLNILLPTTIIAFPFYIFRFEIGGVPTTALEILIYLTFAAVLWGGKRRRIKNISAVCFGCLFVLAGLIGAFIDPNRIQGLGLWKAYFFDGFLLFLLVLMLEPKGQKKILNYIFLSGLLVSIVALILYFAGVMTENGRLLDLDRLSPNYLAMYLTPILVLTFALIRERICSKSSYIWYFLGTLVILGTLVLTQSRGAILAVAVGVLVIAFHSLARGKLKRVARAVFWLLFVGLLVATFCYFRPDWSSHSRKATSSNIRYYIWSTSIEIAKLNPLLGVGISNYQNYFSELTKDRVNYPEFISPQAFTAHNLYLHLYLTCGLLGLATFLAFIFSLKFWRLDEVASSSALISLLIYGLVDTPFFRNDLAALFWLLLALVYLAKVEACQKSKNDQA